MKRLIFTILISFLIATPIFASEVRGNLSGVVLPQQKIQKEINRITLLIEELKLLLKVELNKLTLNK